MPLPYRWLTSLMVRYNGKSILIDCGEGTQIAMKEKGWSPKPIDVICFTHFHADHISGLPGMLLTMGNAERTEPLLLIGPKGLTKVVGALRVIAPELPFEIRCMEISEAEQSFDLGGLRIEAFRVHHNVTCYGYSIAVDRAGKFRLDRAEALGIEKRYWNRLQKGETVEVDGKVYTPDMVMGEARKGLKVTYCTDTRPTEGIVRTWFGTLNQCTAFTANKLTTKLPIKEPITGPYPNSKFTKFRVQTAKMPPKATTHSSRFWMLKIIENPIAEMAAAMA